MGKHNTSFIFLKNFKIATFIPFYDYVLCMLIFFASLYFLLLVHMLKGEHKKIFLYLESKKGKKCKNSFPLFLLFVSLLLRCRVQRYDYVKKVVLWTAEFVSSKIA